MATAFSNFVDKWTPKLSRDADEKLFYRELDALVRDAYDRGVDDGKRIERERRERQVD